MMNTDYTGIILAGGRSTRMGENKSLLELGGTTVILRLVKLMQDLFPQLILITNEPDVYSFIPGIRICKDFHSGIGPLAGIHAGLINSYTDNNFIISCDIPLMTKGVIQFLIDYPTQKKIKVAKADNFIQQLCGTYSRETLPVVEEIIKENSKLDERNPEQTKRGCRVLELVKRTDAEIIDIEKEYSDYKPGTFFNMNRPSEYLFIKNLLQ